MAHAVMAPSRLTRVSIKPYGFTALYSYYDLRHHDKISCSSFPEVRCFTLDYSLLTVPRRMLCVRTMPDSTPARPQLKVKRGGPAWLQPSPCTLQHQHQVQHANAYCQSVLALHVGHSRNSSLSAMSVTI